MKSFKFLLAFFMLSVVLLSCSKDDKTPVFDSDFIKQVKWNGTLVLFGEWGIEDGTTLGLNMFFSTDNRGKFDYTYGASSYNDDFKYRLEDKLLVIQASGDPYISGEWVLIDIDKNRMLWRKNITSDTNYSTLELVRDKSINNKPSGRE